MVELEAKVFNINDVELLGTGMEDVTPVDITDVTMGYTDLIIGDATGIASVDTTAVDVMTEDDAVVNDVVTVVGDSDIVADVVRPPVANYIILCSYSKRQKYHYNFKT